jgi:hypothetical protein
MQKILNTIVQILFLIIVMFTSTNLAQQNEYLLTQDPNIQISVSNYQPKLQELVTIQIKFHPFKELPMVYMSINIYYDKKLETNKEYEIISNEKVMSTDEKGEVEILTMKVRFNKKSVYYFNAAYHHDYFSTIIPFYVEGALPETKVLIDIRNHYSILYNKVEELKTISADKEARRVTSLAYEKRLEHKYLPKNEYEKKILKRIYDNSQNQCNEYIKKFDSLYAIQNTLYEEWKQKRKIIGK